MSVPFKSLATSIRGSVEVDYVPPLVNPLYVDAGPNQVIDDSPTFEGTLTGTASATNSVTPTVLWELVSGPGTVTLGSPDALVTTFQASQNGTYVFKLTASIDDWSESDTTTVALQTPPQPEAVIACTSESGTGTLIGISEYTTPSTPPKKYRREALTGSLDQCAYTNGNNCTVPNGFQGQTRNVVGGAKQYNATTGVLTNTEYWDFWSANPDGTATCSNAIFRSRNNGVAWDSWGNPASGTRTTRTIARITDSYTGTGACVVEGSISYKRTNTATRTLSDEDTEIDAMARAAVTPGTSCTAKIESRGAGDFTFLFVAVAYDITCSNLLPGFGYTATVDLLEENYGGGSPVTTTQEYQFTASGTTHLISDVVSCPSGKQVTVQNVSIDFSA